MAHAATPMFDYKAWGLAQGASGPTAIKPLALEKIAEIETKLSALVPLEGYTLAGVGQVEHFQGADKAPIQLGVLRFTKNGAPCIGTEHISISVNLDTGALIGLTQMQERLVGEKSEDVSHQQALKKAVEFLKVQAPDLMPAAVDISTLPRVAGVETGSKLDFEATPVNIGNVEIHWIGDHAEDIGVGDEAKKIHGMKVKMYIPETKLWAWAVVDKEGKVNTFERNIFWNFELFKRETQMWLHDKWIDAQSLSLLSPRANESALSATAVSAVAS